MLIFSYLVFDVDEPSLNYVVDNRRTKTNRRQMLREAYKPADFNFALVYIENLALHN
ncbi:group I intron-associated PD-(D/E)XK endonuclease [Nostoc sp. CHAB 5715]|uniref:group I intron-associated PD-(D/E)XK endonuclease n=1 Tax=Nostoc sp. CHAB 5715 TaxID=2780400 RepID=UPI001E5CC95E|nr:group I intron-associated PD-(D/E)XK endonuclease [Nostoc sp. CHAB 5715]MCC5620915.1 hypothetical protein [Nostoc sp. CHAB 5715]